MTKKTIYKKGKKIGYTESWHDIMKKPFRLLLTTYLVKDLGLPLYLDEKGLWWLEVNKEKKKK